MTNILITGGAGFLGTNLVRRLQEKEDVAITAISRSEPPLLELKRKYPNVKIIVGDIADNTIARKACTNQNIIYHLAAFKHAPLAEKNTYQCVKSNITGSINLLDNFRGTHFIAMSTDKACDPSYVYGASKFLMEKLIEEYQEINPFTKYRVIRCGNILYSTGSVLCIWKKALLEKKEITITSPNATRYFWSADQVIDYIFDVQYNCDTCLPQATHMKAVKMGTLLEAMQEKYGKTSDINVIGMQPGENLHEKLTKNGPSSCDDEQYTFEEILELIFYLLF